MKAKNLKVHVKEDGRDKVKLTMPIFSVTILDTIMPESVKSKISTVDIKEIIERVKAEEFRPQTLFELEDGAKSYKVWIE
jgi:hypothetical protein